MNNASISLIKVISKSNNINLEELSELMNLGERSLRYKISDCNYHLKRLGFPEIEINKGCLTFKKTFEEVRDIIKINLHLYSFSKEEREEIILYFYLFGEENRTIEDISKMLLVTEVTLKNDLKKIREKLLKYKIILDNINNKGLVLIGKENHKRRLMLDFLLRIYTLKFEKGEILVEKTDSNSFFILLNNTDTIFNRENISSSSEVIKNILEKTSKKISDDDFKRLFFSIIIALERRDCRNSFENSTDCFIEKTEEFLIIKNICTNYNLSNCDLVLFTKYLLGSRTYDFEDYIHKNWFEIESFITELIEDVSNNWGGITFDNDLIDGLINHIKPAIYRIKNNISLETPMYEEFKKTYPKVLDTVEQSILNIKKFYIDFPKEEVAYISMHFYLAMERQKNKIKKNILIVCGSGYSTSRFLEKSILERFSVNIIDVLPYNKLVNYENSSNIDLIITTLTNISSQNHKIVNVSPVLTEKDIELLSKEGLKILNSKIGLTELVNIAKDCSDNLNEELFIKKIKSKYQREIIDDFKKINLVDFKDMVSQSRCIKIKNAISWEDAIKISGNLLVNENFVNNEYVLEIIDLVNKFGNYMTIRDGIFLAHARDLNNVFKTGFSFLLMEEEIEFPEKEKIKLIITLSSKDKKEHLKALLQLINVIDMEDILLLLNSRDNNEFYEKLLQLVKETEKISN